MRARPTSVALALLAGLAAACSDPSDPGVLVAPQMVKQDGGADLGLDVRYYFGGSNCANPADMDANGDWSFPAPLPEDVQFGSAACLIAKVGALGNQAPAGFVLWEICGVPGSVGPKADCETGLRSWGPGTGQVWTEVDAAGEVTTGSHSITCTAGFTLTRGFRYRYSRFDPTTHPVGERLAVTFPAFDVTADDRLCS